MSKDEHMRKAAEEAVEQALAIANAAQAVSYQTGVDAATLSEIASQLICATMVGNAIEDAMQIPTELFEFEDPTPDLSIEGLLEGLTDEDFE